MDVAILAPEKSGSHLVRGIIEYLTQANTLDARGTPINNSAHHIFETKYTDYVASLSHHAITVDQRMREKSLVLLIRNPVESIASNLKLGGNVSPSRINRKWHNSVLPMVSLFQQWHNPKMLIFYEDLLSNPEIEIKRLGDFFKVTPYRVNELISRYDIINNYCYDNLPQKGKSRDDFLYYTKRFHMWGIKLDVPKGLGIHVHFPEIYPLILN